MEKPILFNTAMVQAILEGRKTQTRRIVKPQPKQLIPLGFIIDSTEKKNEGNFAWGKDQYGGIIDYAKPPYRIGDVLWVRETWQKIDKEYFYKADNEPEDWGMSWKPSIHMPHEAARIFLKVTDVKAGRLQDITEEQALSEGIRSYTKDGQLYKYAVSDEWWMNYCNNHKKFFCGTWWQEMPRNPWVAFMYLWDSTIKKIDLDQYRWDANPWVWVIKFEKIEHS